MKKTFLILSFGMLCVLFLNNYGLAKPNEDNPSKMTWCQLQGKVRSISASKYDNKPGGRVEVHIASKTYDQYGHPGFLFFDPTNPMDKEMLDIVKLAYSQNKTVAACYKLKDDNYRSKAIQFNEAFDRVVNVWIDSLLLDRE